METNRSNNERMIYLQSKPKLLVFVLFFTLIITILVSFFNIELFREKNLIVAALETKSVFNSQILEYSNISNKIPILVEKYIYTLYSKYLQNYWLYIDTPPEEKLNDISTSSSQLKNEIFSIETATSSVRKDEIRALKLVFSAYHIPPEVTNSKLVNYQLSEIENKMPDAEKIKAATELLLDVERQNELNKIQDLIEQFRLKVNSLNQGKIKYLQERMYNLEAITLALNGLLLLLVFLIFWLISRLSLLSEQDTIIT